MHRLAPIVVMLLAACAPPESDEGDPRDFEPADLQYDVPVPADAGFHPSRVIVGFEDDGADDQLDGFDGLLAERALTRVRQLGRRSAALYELPDGVDVRDAVDELRESGRFDYVEPDYERHILATVDDTYRVYQWNFDALDAESAWDYSTGSGAVVAVLDTGSSSGSADGLSSLISGYDFVNGDSDPKDDNGHGTHVSGTINQATDNGAGVAGLAYGADLMPVKVMDKWGSGYSSDLIDGIDYAVANGADVINMSLGSTYYSTTEATAVYDAYKAGVFVAAASGNSGLYPVEYPAGYAGVVAVGATDYNNKRVYYSNRGGKLDLMAPGGDNSVDENADGYADGILQETFDPSWGYYFWEGTSMASPHVAAAAALLMANGASNLQAEAYLEDYAMDLGKAGFDNWNGNGLVQPADALAAWDAYVTTGCTITLDSVSWLVKTSRLAVWASSSDNTETLYVYADGTYLGAMTYKGWIGSYKALYSLTDKPTEVTLASDCGGSDSFTF